MNPINDATRSTPAMASLDDDMRQYMFAAAAAGQPFALATIFAADGGPRPVGAQMVVTQRDAWGFLSGGCIEADVALHGRQVLADGEPRTLVYGRGSPFVDMRLPCGGRIEVLVECIDPSDPAIARLRTLSETRVPAIWLSDGQKRRCAAHGDMSGDMEEVLLRRPYPPRDRLIVAGTDAFALAIAGLGATIGWETILLTPVDPATPTPPGVRCDRRPVAQALADLAPDAWTAIAMATHELDADREALVPALRSGAGYVGVLGSQRRIPERRAALGAAGLSDAEIARLHAPIGLAIRARSPWEVAVSIMGEIIALRSGEPGRAQASVTRE